MSTRQTYHGLGFILLIFALFSGNWFLWLFGGFFFFMSGLASWWARNLTRWVQVEWSADQSRVMPGTPITVRLRLHNRSWLPLPGTLVQFSLPDHVVPEQADEVVERNARTWIRFRFHLPMRKTAERTFVITPHKRGVLWLGEAQFETIPLFGEEAEALVLPFSFSVLVYPLPLPIPPLDTGTSEPEGSRVTRSHPIEDVTFLRGVRAYSPGDRLKHIHWKASAKTGLLQTRLFEPTANPKWIVIGHILPSYEPVLQKHNDAVNERTISGLAALSVLCRRQSLSYELLLTVRQRGREHYHQTAGSGKAHHIQIMTYLSKLHQYAPTSLAAVLHRLEQQSAAEARIVIVTPRLDEPALEMIERLIRRGHHITVLDVSQDQPVIRRYGLAAANQRRVSCR
ncbi:DUF58 domain-containing protein [Brevibacillus borstelensis]|uniref:DUF58 domain-containing protein n=1 Tax=Brevibacillus borstelensis TaxID=45462 RepID=UPI0004F3AF5B|nr:DUF58 domain-containing protein [Brevibacillus borstelensis]KKX54929.1 hypothetical protein X546_12040 [Brevibacillus borstelensis cifa_chp40]